MTTTYTSCNIPNYLLILVGPSGSGKTTVEKELIKSHNFTKIVSSTTREIRDGEIDGVDYNFVSLDEFNSQNLIAQIHISDSWKYGTNPSELNKFGRKVFSVINIEYAVEMSKTAWGYGINSTIIFFNINKDTRLKNLLNRGESSDSINKRFLREDNPIFVLEEIIELDIPYFVVDHLDCFTFNDVLQFLLKYENPQNYELMSTFERLVHEGHIDLHSEAYGFVKKLIERALEK